MTLTALLNLPVVIVSRTASADNDIYGDSIDTETRIQTVGELQQQRRSEPIAGGETSDETWLCILPAGTNIDTDDAIIANGQRYELIGAPWHARNPRTRLESHVEATLRRVASTDDQQGS